MCSYQRKSTYSVYKLKDCVVHLYIFLMHKKETFGFELINSKIKLIRKYFLVNDILIKHSMIFHKKPLLLGWVLKICLLFSAKFLLFSWPRGTPRG